MLKTKFFISAIYLSLAPLSANAQIPSGSENIVELNIQNNGVTFNVRSGGCTDKASFIVLVRRDNLVPDLELIRHTPDTCRFPGFENITFKWSEIGFSSGDKFKLINQISVP